MEIPTLQTISDDCLRMADTLYNARHETPRMVAVGGLLTSIWGVITFSTCTGVVLKHWLSSSLFYLNIGQLLLSVLLIAAELARVFPSHSVEHCVEHGFGFLSHAFARAMVYFYLGFTAITLGYLSYMCYILAPLMLAMGVLTIVFRQQEQNEPEGRILTEF